MPYRQLVTIHEIESRTQEIVGDVDGFIADRRFSDLDRIRPVSSTPAGLDRETVTTYHRPVHCFRNPKTREDRFVAVGPELAKELDAVIRIEKEEELRRLRGVDEELDRAKASNRDLALRYQREADLCANHRDARFALSRVVDWYSSAPWPVRVYRALVGHVGRV